MTKKIKVLFSVFLFALVFTACQNHKKQEQKTTDPAQRIVSLNSAVTEIISALGYQEDLVGRDVTSTYPEFVKDSVKDLGHVRSLSIEPLISLHPHLILASAQDMENDLEKKLKESGVKYKAFQQEFSVQGTKKLIKEVADFIGHADPEALLNKIDQDLKKVKPLKNKPEVLFIYARGAGTLLVAGEDTPMAHMIALAGGENAVKDFKDFKPLTAEALLNHNPDVILLFDSGLKSLNGKKGLLESSSIAETKAGKNEAVITMDGALLSGFGPRVGEAAYTLNQLLEPYAE